MYYDDDDDDIGQFYFAFYNNEDESQSNAPNITNINIAHSCGVFCRSCSEYHKYGVADGVTNDGKCTCWRCFQSLHRRLIGVPQDKRKSFNKFYFEKFHAIK